MIDAKRPLGGFETRLESELVKVVAARGAATAPAGRPLWRRPAVRVGVLVAAAVAAVTVPLSLNGTDQPAFAVTSHPDGSLTVTVNDYRHPERLEARLKATGASVRVISGVLGPDCKRLLPTQLPTREQVMEIFKGDVRGSTFDFVPSKIPAGVTAYVEIFKDSDRMLTITGATLTAAPEKRQGCGRNGAAPVAHPTDR